MMYWWETDYNAMKNISKSLQKFEEDIYKNFLIKITNCFFFYLTASFEFLFHNDI